MLVVEITFGLFPPMPSSSSALNPSPSWVALTFAVIAASMQILLLSFGEAEPSRTVQFWELMLGSAWSWWVYVNRRRSKQGYAFEFDALVFFAWPIVVPYYLVKSHSSRSKFSAIPIWLLYALPFVIAIVCYVLSSAQTEP